MIISYQSLIKIYRKLSKKRNIFITVPIEPKNL